MYVKDHCQWVKIKVIGLMKDELEFPLSMEDFFKIIKIIFILYKSY